MLNNYLYEYREIIGDHNLNYSFPDDNHIKVYVMHNYFLFNIRHVKKIDWSDIEKYLFPILPRHKKEINDAIKIHKLKAFL